MTIKDPREWSSEEDLQLLIGQPEGLRIEFKISGVFEKSLDSLAGNLSECVSAFANTEGGVIVIGMVERKEGKMRVADHLDDGVNSNEWSPERLQQLIEGNIRPYLTGLRVKRIPLRSDFRKCAYVVIVPPGTTAYQAKDNRYYGRSEFENKSLPDHEIRFRMFRGRIPQAEVEVADSTVEEHGDITEEDLNRYYEAYDFPASVKRRIRELLQTSKGANLTAVKFRLRLRNTGDVNISEFKVKTDWPYHPNAWSRKDGWPIPRDVPLAPYFQQVNIYPGDAEEFGYVTCYIFEDDTVENMVHCLSWTLYLRDTTPVSGSIDLRKDLTKPCTS